MTTSQCASRTTCSATLPSGLSFGRFWWLSPITIRSTPSSRAISTMRWPAWRATLTLVRGWMACCVAMKAAALSARTIRGSFSGMASGAWSGISCTQTITISALWPWFRRAANSTARTDAPRSRIGTSTLRIDSTDRTVLVAPRGAGGGTRSIQPRVPARPIVKATASVMPSGLRVRLNGEAAPPLAAARRRRPAGRRRRWRRARNVPGSGRGAGSAHPPAATRSRRFGCSDRGSCRFVSRGVALSQDPFIFLERLELFRLAEHALLRLFPVTLDIAHRRQFLPAAVDHIKDAAEQDPPWTCDPAEWVREDHLEERDRHPDHAEHPKHGKIDPPPFDLDRDVEGHPVRTRRIRIFEPKRDQGDENDEVAGGRTESVKVGQQLNSGIVRCARAAGCEEGDQRLHDCHAAEDDDRSRRGRVSLVDLVEPTRHKPEKAHRVGEARGAHQHGD